MSSVLACAQCGAFPAPPPHMMSAVLPLPRRAARAVTSRYQTPPLPAAPPWGAACTQPPAPARGCFCARACPLPRQAASVMLPRHHPTHDVRRSPWGVSPPIPLPVAVFAPSSGRPSPGSSACPPQSVPVGGNCSRTGDRLPRRRSFFRGGGIGW